MKKILLGLVLMFIGTVVIGQTQKLPVQGKLYEENIPVNGVRNFTFSIPAISWSEGPITLQVTGGLYTIDLDVPSNLFESANSLSLEIEVGGSLLSTVQVHAPIEKDPTVTNHVKDGITWSEVTEKPANFDLDPSNEIQTLELDGNNLSISGGNTVEISGGTTNTTSFDSLIVGPAQLSNIFAAESQTGIDGEFESEVSQSFIALKGGRLVSIEIECSAPVNESVQFSLKRVADGQSIAGNFISDFTSSLSYQALTPLNSNVIIEQYESYILEITVQGGNYLFSVASDDPYPFGESSFGPEIDLKFRVNIEAEVGPNFSVGTDGGVGIGLSNPSAALEVNGRIKDKTGFVMPVGSILPYAGSSEAPIPEGWLLCDGSLINKVEYADLFLMLGTAWGHGDGDDNLFRLPDLRGEFLRGWSGDSGNDPQASTRIRRYPGSLQGNFVGSYQDDSIKRHRHTLDSHHTSPSSTGIVFVLGDFSSGTQSLQVTQLTGSDETRPRNAAVLYIIKY